MIGGLLGDFPPALADSTIVGIQQPSRGEVLGVVQNFVQDGLVFLARLNLLLVEQIPSGTRRRKKISHSRALAPLGSFASSLEVSLARVPIFLP